MTPARHLSVTKREPAPRTDRGRLLYVADVQTEIFRGGKSKWWIRRNVAPESRIKVGRDIAWWETDVLAWLDAQAAPRSA